MRVAFITGRLELGSDGVGDYTRTLAKACARQGHAVCLLSIGENERTPNDADGDDGGMRTLRLSRAEWLSDGGDGARRWLETFKPDWTSLQFVPYSLDPRGLFQAAIPALVKTLSAASRRQIFFHETWIGSQEGAPLKARVVGWAQRRAVKQLVCAINPARTHTSNAYYRAALGTIGCDAGILPMIGSVPLVAGGAEQGKIEGLKSDALVCGMFGTLHPNWRPEVFLEDFAAMAKAMGKPAALVAAGGLGYGEALFAKLAEEWRGRVECIAAGRGDEARLARLFARFDFAVTSVPWNILGKSSSAAALREHGLRVVVTEAGAPARFAPTEANEEEAGVPYFRSRELLATALVKRPAFEGAPLLAEIFLRDLHAAR